MVSRPQLYRKLKALTGLSPSVFLRQLRMQEARRLLQTGQYNVHRMAEKPASKTLPTSAKLINEKWESYLRKP